MHKFRLKIQRDNITFADVAHPVQPLLSDVCKPLYYIDYKLIPNKELGKEYKQKMLSDGFNTWDIEDAFLIAEEYGKLQDACVLNINFEILAPIYQGELEYLTFTKSIKILRKLKKQKIYKILSFQNDKVFTYYFTFQNQILPQDKLLLKLICEGWDVVCDNTFYNTEFWKQELSSKIQSLINHNLMMEAYAK